MKRTNKINAVDLVRKIRAQAQLCIAMVFPGLFASVVAFGAAATVSVCAVIAEPVKYNGQLVTINGDDLDNRTGREFQTSLPKGFEFDLSSWERAEQVPVQLRAKEPNLRFVRVTVEGVLLDNGPEPHGVTRHPWHPATLVIAKIREVKS